jgi:hypothetical protein
MGRIHPMPIPGRKIMRGTIRGTISCLCLVVASALAMPLVAQASSYSGAVVGLRYGNDTNRISVQVSTPHTTNCSTNTIFYTFSGKPFWAEAFIEALTNNKNVSIIGTGSCTLGVEEIGSFDVIK